MHSLPCIYLSASFYKIKLFEFRFMTSFPIAFVSHKAYFAFIPFTHEFMLFAIYCTYVSGQNPLYSMFTNRWTHILISDIHYCVSQSKHLYIAF